MNDNLDDELRRALRPVDPGDEFTRALMARVSAQKVTEIRRPTRSPLHARVLPWAPAALAASLLIAIFVTHEHHQRHDVEEGLRARQELLEALRVTSEKLDIAYQVVHNESDGGADADTGA
jgi:hypothetical protein